jgi:hypothetical protein
MRSTEKATQAAILAYLSLKGVFHWRNNTGAYKPDHGGFIRFGYPGSPDIFAIRAPGGQLIGIEVKDGRGRLNANQAEFRDRLEAAGGQYVVARSLDDVLPLF